MMNQRSGATSARSPQTNQSSGDSDANSPRPSVVLNAAVLTDPIVVKPTTTTPSTPAHLTTRLHTETDCGTGATIELGSGGATTCSSALRASVAL